MTAESIAIVGSACLLPGAASPEELWSNVVAARDCVTRAPKGRWRLDENAIACAPSDDPSTTRDRTWSDRGGYVEGFDGRFDPRGFAIDAELVASLDPLFQWLFHAGRIATGDRAKSERDRAAVIVGNLSFPSASLNAMSERHWLSRSGLDDRALDRLGLRPRSPLNRFTSGLPAQLLARALGFGGEAFALDAACASSLYAIKLACDRLRDRRADLVVAGGVNKTDDLFIHVGFCALQAMSKTGQSRPFHRDADGLVPAEGVALFALKRLDDAVDAGDTIHAVIRGVGLANDGRGAGILAPAAEGQLRAMRRAYAESGVRPREISLFECHATGTRVGDATEIESLSTLLREDGVTTDAPIGSLKSNLGHLITAAGGAGVMKVIGAMKAETRPPTLHCESRNPALDGSPLRLLDKAEAWPSDRARLAAVSAFGFGGNDAHAIVEEWRGPNEHRRYVRIGAEKKPTIAIVAVAMQTSVATDGDAFTRALASASAPASHAIDHVEIDPRAVRFPPRDLQQALPQQLLVLRAACDAAALTKVLPNASTSVVVGIGCDAEIARFGARWRSTSWGQTLGASTAWSRAAADAFVAPLEAAGVVGTMPNIPANRINSALDARGPSFTVSAEEASGLVALEIAAHALAHREINAAIVAAVDLSCEEIHRRAVGALVDSARAEAPGDAAIALVLKRLDDAIADGETIVATVGASSSDGHDAQRFVLDETHAGVTASTGHAHAASGLLLVAAAALGVHHRVRSPVADASLDDAVPWLPGTRARVAHVDVKSRHDVARRVTIADAPSVSARPLLLRDAPRIALFCGADRDEVLRALDARREGGDGPARLTIVARDDRELTQRVAHARARLADSNARGVVAPGCVFHARPILEGGGELAFVFTGAASAYRGMGRTLALAFPDCVARLERRFGKIDEAAGWIYRAGDDAISPVDKLWGTSFLSQLHAEILQHVLGVRPRAAIGVSSGETNALFALGAFTDMDVMHADVDASGLYTTALGGDFGSVRKAWGLPEGSPIAWENLRIVAPVADVRRAIEEVGEGRVHVTIVQASDDCVIGGDAAACRRVVGRLGSDRARSIGYDLAIHCSEVEAWRDEWWKLHRRHVTPVDGVRFYAHAFGTHYALSSDRVADALTGQAVRELDFPSLIEGAHRDGVRMFVELGPQSGCSRWIEQALGRDKSFAAVSLDYLGEDSIDRLVHAAAHLIAAGVDVDHEALASRLALPKPTPTNTRAMRFAAHWPTPNVPPLDAASTKPLKIEPAVTSPASTKARTNGATRNGHHASRMLPAPSLLAVSAARPTAMRGEAIPSVRVAEPVQMQAHDAPRSTVVESPSQHAIAELHRRVAEMHTSFVEQQSQLHARFLATRGAVRAAAAAPLASRVEVERSTIAGRGSEPVVRGSEPVVRVSEPVVRGSEPVVRVSEPVVRGSEPVVRVSEPAARRAEIIATPNARLAGGSLSVDPPRRPVGPAYSRAELEVLAGGKISAVLGPLFAQQDDFRRQVRMPMEPLLLADRVLGIDAEPGVVGKGTLWTETDVTWESWYLHDGRIPAGVMIEAGQADLLLISWMGADFVNKGERVYRLLGCELTYHVDPKRGGTAGLPRAGETLRYDIHVDGHANLGDVRIFFFHYDCRVHPTHEIGEPESGVPVLSVRRGQAGFFTDDELANSGGILWTPEEGEKASNPRVDPPRVASVGRSFSRAQIEAFTRGHVRECFGDTHAIAETHVRTPRIGKGRLDFLGEVTDLDPNGGPWKRGYLRAVTPVTPKDWFFEGHFKDDPCMPGTLMFEACQQAMAFYLAALGHTLDKDGWRFEPVPEETYKLLCRGQVTPAAKELVYEVFVDELIDDPETGRATIFADLLCTVDGLKAFHCRSMGIQLSPDFPSGSNKSLALAPKDSRPCAVVLEPDGVTRFAFDLKSLIACAWGKPSDGFGRRFETFDGHRRTPRLPGPPYHFMSRVTKVTGDLFEVKAGAEIEVEYDLDPSAWYFEQTAANGHAGSMPYCVMLEAALQPCGWLASATGVTLTEAADVAFRNLDGHSIWHRELRPSDQGPLVTRTKLTSLSRAAGMIIVAFEVFSFLRDSDREIPVFTMKTVFGFFPTEALAAQAGLTTTAADRVWLEAPSNVMIDLKSEPARFFADAPRMTPGMLRVVDRITGDWPSEAGDGTGRVRAEKDIAHSEWFFKAHFFQDPVQPGSLGIEAMIEVVQAWVKLRDLAAHLENPRFEPIAIGPLHEQTGDAIGKATWKYRGQVLPHNKVVTTEAEVTKVITTAESVTVVANVWLWVDGMRIYSCHGVAVRAVGGARVVETEGTESAKPTGHGGLTQSNAPDFSRGSSERSSAPRDSVEASHHGRAGPDLSKALPIDSDHEFTIDPQTSPWVLDHCPTYTVPTLPFTSLADSMASAARALAPELRVARLREVRVHRWVTFPPFVRDDGSIGFAPARMKTVTTPGPQGEVGVELLVWREAKDAKLSRFEVAASAKVRLARAFEPPMAPSKVDASEIAQSPYATGMFHGPAFQRVRALKRGASASVATIDAASNATSKDVPVGAIAPLLLDAALHGIPHDELWRWCAEIDRDLVGYPFEVEAMTFHAPTPTRGTLTSTARFDRLIPGADGMPPRARVLVQVAQEGRVWADLALVEVLLPKGPLGRLSAHERRRFLADRAFVEGAALSLYADGETRLRDADVRGSDWLPGTLATAYRFDRQPASLDATTKIAIAEHVARIVSAHPSTIAIDADGRSATSDAEPISRRAIEWRRDGDAVVVKSGPVSTDLTRIRKHWSTTLGVDRWLIGDLYFGLLERFVRRVVVHDPAGIAAISGRGAIFLANHQVGVESLLFSITASSLVRGSVATLAKDEHRRTWIGNLIELGERYPGVTMPESIVFFDRKDESSLLDIGKRLGAMLKGGGSLMVHVEGTRALAARQPVQKMASLWIDLALSSAAPIVPVRFVGGLPVEPLASRLDFPIGYGAQEIHVGAPIDLRALASMSLVERTRAVLSAINELGGPLDREQPCAPNVALASSVETAMRRGLTEDRAVLLRTLEQSRAPSEETSVVLSAILGQRAPQLPDDAKGRWLAEAIAWLGGASRA